MTRHIEGELKSVEIEYDIDIRKSDFGYASSRIIAYAALPVVKRLIESKRGGDFSVKISPVRKRTEFVPLDPKPTPSQIRPRFFILGIDPGTTAAICLLSLTGEVHLLISKKNLTRADIIRMVYEHGIPVMVATDVPQPPRLVEKIARLVNAETFSPGRPIPVAEKQELAREYSETTKIRNAHERDALTAAVYAFRSIQSKLRQIDRKIREEQIAIDRSHLKALVIKGTPINEAIASLTREESEVIEVEPKSIEAEEPLTQDRFDALGKKYGELEDEQKILTDQIDDLKRLVEYLRFRESELSESLDIVGEKNYWRIKRDRELGKKEQELQRTKKDNDRLGAEVKNLEKRLELLRGVKRLEIRGDMLAVKIVDKFTQESIEEYMRKVATIKRGDIILFEDASGGGPQTARLLIEREIRAVIVDTPVSHLAKEELVKAVIPVVEAVKVELSRIDEFAFISRKKFEKQLQEFLKDAREQARLRGEEQLIEIIEKYRREIER
jgi:predicted RNase H-like nuclease (RuvC/YqgF family)